jgi:hypothetical protein
MKKIYSILCTMLLAVIAFSAKADYTVKFVCDRDDAAYIAYYQNYEEQTVDLVNGEVSVTVPQYANIKVYGKNSWCVKNVECSGDTYPNDMGTYWSLYIYDDYTFTVTTCSEDELYDGQIQIKADNPSLIDANFSSSYRDALENVPAGEWTTVKYITSKEKTLYIYSKDYNASLYKVWQNEEEVEASWGSYYVSLNSGDKIEIQAEYPDADATISYSITEGCEGAISAIKIDDEEVEFTDNSYTSKLGKIVKFSFDTDNYKINNIYVNGEYNYYYSGDFSVQLANENTTVSIDATKYETISATINVDDPTRVYITRPVGWSTELLELKAGDNTFEFTAGSNDEITIYAATDCKITSISDGTKEYFEGSTNTYVTVTDGMTLTITSSTIERDHKAVYYISGYENANWSAYIQRSTRTEIALHEGYGYIEFDDSENPFQAGFYGTNLAPFDYYLDGEQLTPNYSSDSGFYIGSINLNENSVLKFYLGSTPSWYNVTFTCEEGVEEGFNVTTDLVTDVDNFVAGLKVLTGTQVDIQTFESEASVKVNGEAVEAVDGVYTFNVNADTNVELSLGDSGVEGVNINKVNTTNAVYNLQGVKLFNNANDSQLKALPAGVYIVNGKKVLVK